MSDERRGNGNVQIVIALIGLAGAVGAAWITAGAKFERDLEKRAQLDELIDTANSSARALRAAADSAEKLKSLGASLRGGKKASP